MTKAWAPFPPYMPSTQVAFCWSPEQSDQGTLTSAHGCVPLLLLICFCTFTTNQLLGKVLHRHHLVKSTHQIYEVDNISILYKGNRGSEKLGNLPKITELVRGRAGGSLQLLCISWDRQTSGARQGFQGRLRSLPKLCGPKVSTRSLPRAHVLHRPELQA